MREFIRQARLDEAEALTALTLRSKSYWGYSAEFMAAATPDLTFQAAKFGPEFLVFVLELNGDYTGFYSLIPRGGTTIELYDLFIDPARIGGGLGSMLFGDAVSTARRLGYRTMLITADPHAEGFYRKQGAVTREYWPSPIDADRRLPRMEYRITE